MTAISVQIVTALERILNDWKLPQRTEEDRGYFGIRLERLAHASQVLDSLHPNANFAQLTIQIRNALQVVQTKSGAEEMGTLPILRTLASGSRGRPSIDLTKEQLDFYIKYNFTIPQISQMLLISESTIKRRMNLFGMSKKNTFTTLSDADLDIKTNSIMAANPDIGYKRMKGIQYIDTKSCK